MRIVHAHKYFHRRDGASRYEVELMRLQEEAGHVVAPFAMHDPRNDPTPWSKYFVSSLETRELGGIGDHFRQLARAFWCTEAQEKMGRLLDVFRPDVVHAHNLYTHLSPAPLAECKKRDIPVVLTVHDYAMISANYGLWSPRGPISPTSGLLKVASTKFIKGSFAATFVLDAVYRLQRMLKLYDRAIAKYLVSSTFMRDAMISVGYDARKIVHLPLFVDGPDAGERSLKPYVFFAGRLEAYKGVDVLIKAMKKLPELTLKIAGTGPDEARLRSLVTKGQRVEFLGFVQPERVRELMRDATAVVVPSVWYEPFGLVALEAMRVGAPVIVSKTGGLAEVVEDRLSGLVVPPGDERALAKALQCLVDDPGLSCEISQNARKRAQTLGNPQLHLAKIVDLYSK